MELRQIYYFMEAANREHITQASEALHVAQSAISRQIALLEDELGVPLFREKEGTSSSQKRARSFLSMRNEESANLRRPNRRSRNTSILKQD
ncbi:GltC, transcription activator of glutamate synthase operon [Sporolactobacillus inulinus]|uniref:GltC, transcription activator of glutamate synthase operon n=2 Tax=Sporolactobacillus inulinus TaxID=2078 RepID=A0A4Y1ZDN3_9BACL|nr:GltC, transcription activator of glutamate synthase operon [Sporolactobacillus inulinus]